MMDEFELNDGSEFSSDCHVCKHDTLVYFDESSHVLAKRLRCEPTKKYAKYVIRNFVG